MRFLTIFYLFLCIASGSISFFIYLVLYFKYRLKEIKYYLYFLLTVSFIGLIITINFYYKSIFLFNENKIYNFIFFSILLLGDCLYIFTLPYFIQSIIKRELIKKNVLLLIASIPIFIYLFLIIFNFIYKIQIDIPKVSVYCANFIIIPCVFYVFCLILYHLQNIKEPLRKKILKIILMFFLLYSPFALIDCFYDTFIFIFRYLPDGFSFSAFYYILGNIIALFLCRKYLFDSNYNKSRELSKDIIKKYNITSREKEIAIFIMDGYSNKEISDKAFISMTTVKKHVYNIFQKTGAKNRVDLINILKDNVKSYLTN